MLVHMLARTMVKEPLSVCMRVKMVSLSLLWASDIFHFIKHTCAYAHMQMLSV